MQHPDAPGLPVEFGNAGAVDTQGTGWFVGYSDWCKTGTHQLRHVDMDSAARGPLVKWFAHPPGDPAGQVKPLSTGRTVSVLVSEGGEFRIDFCADPVFSRAQPPRTACASPVTLWSGAPGSTTEALACAPPPF